MEADIICSVLVMRYLSGRNTCFLSLANVYLAVCGLTRTLQPVFSPVRFRLLSMFPTSPTGNRDSSKNMIERTAVALFFCLFLFLWFPYINPSLWTNCMIITGLSRLWVGNVNIPLPSKKGTAVFYDLFYSERYDYDSLRIEELVKRAFMTLTHTMFTFDNEQLSAAILLFITLHQNKNDMINIFTSCAEGIDNSVIARRVECIKSFIWYLIQNGYKHYSFDIDVDKKKMKLWQIIWKNIQLVNSP